MNLPNLLTIARILLAPFIIWLIITGEMLGAFIAFLVAGVSDGVDGFLAKRWSQVTQLGAHLDPLADKLLLVSIYVALGVGAHLPPWVVILVVSRDMLILGGLVVAWFMDRPMEIKPLMISKVNTFAQILLAGSVLGVLGLGIDVPGLIQLGSIAVGALTVASGSLYLRDWLAYVANLNDNEHKDGEDDRK
ncbi:MAG TPA: CDP-alcohol phosphatidyltransferase family protein [Aestuariivirgaceae bacterium]|nr:CDP-alcohol phosphatidyltransferase family protein [Aestuariivirgaceae bacterium]